MLWRHIIPEDLDYFVKRTVAPYICFGQMVSLYGFVVLDKQFTTFFVQCSYFNLLFAFFQVWPIVI